MTSDNQQDLCVFLYTKLKSVATVIGSFNSGDISPWPKPYGLVNNKTKLQALASRAPFWLTMTDTTTFATDSQSRY